MVNRSPPSTPDNEAQALLQRRVANLGLVLAAIGGTLLVMRVVAVLAVGRVDYLLSGSMVVHYLGVLLSLGMWLACRRGVRSRGLIYAIELLGLCGSGCLYAVMALGIPQAFRPEMTILIAFTVFLLAHAVHVPCSWRWTASLGAVLGIPLVAGAWAILTPLDPRIVAASSAAPNSVQTTAGSIIGIGMASVVTWWVVVVTTAAVASGVIYGLRHEIRKARRLGQYTLERKLGEGGMGIVYRATHGMLRRPTAIKLLLPERVGEAALARFEREVRATARLSHPNTVTVFDFGRTDDGLFYYAMELLDGASLSEIVELSGPLPARRVAHILYQVAGALAEAHGLGLIHRDIKPANIMLTIQGGVADVAKVVDFGLVKELSGGGDVSVTGENAVIGTPLCLAPEAIRGEGEDDGGRDLYALGCVAFFLLTGEHVFMADTPVAVCSLHLSQEPEQPSARLGAAVPEDLEELVMELLAKQVEDRPASAAELLRRLEGCRCFGDWTQTEARRWWREHRAELQRQREDSDRKPEPSHSDTLSVDVHLRAEQPPKPPDGLTMKVEGPAPLSIRRRLDNT